MERIPQPGEFYRHFKDKLYQIIAIAKHSETGEQMVVYQALYGDFGVYVRPLEMFISAVDREKYPDAGQKYRFERVIPGNGTGNQGQTVRGKDAGEAAACSQMGHAVSSREEDHRLSPLVMPFVEADTNEHRLEILLAMRGNVQQKDLDVLYTSLDLPQRGGNIENQLSAIEKYLEMQMHFDGNRLR